MNPQISICMAAARPYYWARIYNSLLQNTVSWELIMVGPRWPEFILPPNMRFYYSHVKPSQAYEFALRSARGELIGWSADDADYNFQNCHCPNALDSVYQIYEESILKYGDKKTIISMRQHEDGDDNWNNHRFFHKGYNTPLMAPFGFINREFYNSLGGYDRNFICGQSENDIVMRAMEDGGRVDMAMDAHVYIHHKECHGHYAEGYTFRHGYNGDRAYLESCWVKPDGTISPKRLKPLEPFKDDDILRINQGPAERWADEAVKV